MINRTIEERQAALALARELRSKRSDFRKATKKGAEVVINDDPVFRGMRVKYYIEAHPAIGKTKAAKIMKDLGISPCKKMGGLSIRQSRKLWGWRKSL